MTFSIMEYSKMCSDIESDGGRERKSPWPPLLEEPIWKDRVRIRRALKQDKRIFREVWESQKDEFCEFWRNLPLSDRRRLFQVPKEDVISFMRTTCDIGTELSAVFCTLMQQLEHFSETGYACDAKCPFEINFEQNMQVYRGAFVISEGFLEDDCFLDYFEHCATSPHLLPKSTSELINQDASDDEKEDTKEDETKQSIIEDFSPDRRIVRYVVFRVGASMILRRFKLQNN